MRHKSIALLAAMLLIAPLAFAWPGSLVLKNGAPHWGQYREMKSLVAAPLDPSRPIGDYLWQYPYSGATAVLLQAQTPGQPFFTQDGAAIDAAEQARMQQELDAVNAFDMLPVVILFNPDSGAQLQDEAAYATAAVTFCKTFGTANWFLLCIGDEAEKFASYDPAAVALDAAKAVRDAFPKQIIAAGGSEASTMASLLEKGSPIEIALARVAAAGTLTMPGPRVEVLSATALTDDVLAGGFKKAVEDLTYGFALAPQSDPAAFLDRLANSVDAYQKATYPGTAPDPADTFSLKPGEKEDGFISLFNGKDLSGWIEITKPGNFKVVDGTIKLIGKSGGWLRSWQPYGDYVFRAEFKIAEGGNSGFFMRAPLMNRASRIGFEVQVFGNKADDPPIKDSCAAIYDVKPPDGHFMKPGDWNEYEISCIGEEITIIWNGKQAHHFKYSDIDFMKNRARKGYIGLQDHHSDVQFRNIRIKPLN